MYVNLIFNNGEFLRYTYRLEHILHEGIYIFIYGVRSIHLRNPRISLKKL